MAGLLAALAAVKERRTTFRETRHFAALDNALESTGHLVFRPGYLEKSTDWPQPERLQVEAGRVVITAGNEAPRVVDLGFAPELGVLIDAIRGPLAGDAGALERAFRPTVSGTMAGWVLELVPLKPGLLGSVRLSGVGGAVEEIRMVQANGDWSVMRMAGV